MFYVTCLGIDTKYTIFDIDSPNVDRCFVFTALTRSTKLSNINIFKSSDQTIESLKKSMMKRYLTEKISLYSYNDKINNRLEKNNYINLDWFESQLKKHSHCKKCNEKYYIEIFDGKCYSNVTADRINNLRSHVIDNMRRFKLKGGLG